MPACATAGATDHTVTHCLYIHDPDGNEIELYIDVPGVDWAAEPELLMSPMRPLRLSPRRARRAAGQRLADVGPGAAPRGAGTNDTPNARGGQFWLV